MNSASKIKDNSIKGKVLKGGVNLAVGQVFTQICSFARNVIIARLISPTDFGIASLFAISLSLVEMISSLAAEKLIVQTAEGDSESFQSTVQGIQFIRGCLTGIILFLIAGPLANLFGVEDARWAFQWLGLIPLMRGLIHQDINRLQRHMRFGPSILVEAISIGIVTLFSYPLGKWLNDYSCMLWLILAQAFLGTVLSHVVAERRYRWALEKKYVNEMVRFGWPLLINGVLLFGILQGDRFVIGSADRIFGRNLYSLQDLGIYSVAFALTFAPTMFIANISIKLFLPLLANAQTQKEIFTRRYDFVCQAITLFGGGLAIPLIISGGWIVRVVYGERYAANAGELVGWLAAMQALRIIRTGPTLGALAKGDTQNALYSNIVRSVSFVAALYIAAIGENISFIAASGFAGELLALGFCLWRLKRKYGIQPIICLKLSFIVGTFMLAGPIFILLLQEPVSMTTSFLISGVTVMLFFSGILIIFQEFRKEMVGYVYKP